MTTITRKFTFDAGHRVLGHEGRCKALHGHTYCAEITVTADGLDNLGRVIDFSVLKEKVGRWIDAHLDHNMILNSQDPLLAAVRELMPYDPENGLAIWDLVFSDSKMPHVLQNENPTAENIARILFEESSRLLNEHSLRVVNVRLWETPNCFADYSGPSSASTSQARLVTDD